MTGRVLTLAWQAAPSPDGGGMVADSDTRISASSPEPERRTLWAAAASAVGDREGSFPYASGQVSVYAPQHTHPQPSLADFYLGARFAESKFDGSPSLTVIGGGPG